MYNLLIIKIGERFFIVIYNIVYKVCYGNDIINCFLYKCYKCYI